MTEAKWLSAEDFRPLLGFVPSHKPLDSSRKRLLLYAAVGRRLLPHLQHPCYVAFVETAEAFADGQATQEAFIQAHGAVHHVRDYTTPASPAQAAATSAVSHLGMGSLWLDQGLESAVSAVGLHAATLTGLLPPKPTVDQLVAIRQQPAFTTPARAERSVLVDLIREVRNTWQFFRDRRPETYGAITQL